MEWYFWVLIIYAFIIFMNVVLAFNKHKVFGLGFFRLIAFFTLMFISGLIFSPVFWLFSFYSVLIYDTPKYETFTIHPLTEGNKITLSSIGFHQGDFVSTENCDYSGFRLYDQRIRISYDGRVAVGYLYTLSRQQKDMIKLIKDLPKDEEKENENGTNN